MTKSSEKKINFFFINEGGEMKVEFIRFQLKLKYYAIRLANHPSNEVGSPYEKKAVKMFV
jgi:hypothetical protein